MYLFKENNILQPELSDKSYYDLNAMLKYIVLNGISVDQKEDVQIILDRIFSVFKECQQAKSLKDVKILTEFHENKKSLKKKVENLSLEEISDLKGYLRPPLIDYKAFNISKNHRMIAKEINNSIFFAEIYGHYEDISTDNKTFLDNEMEFHSSEDLQFVEQNKQNKALFLKKKLDSNFNYDDGNSTLYSNKTLIFPINLVTHTQMAYSCLNNHPNKLEIVKNMIDNQELCNTKYSKIINNFKNDVLHTLQNQLILSSLKFYCIAQDNLEKAINEKIKDLTTMALDIYNFSSTITSILNINDDVEKFKKFFGNKIKHVFESVEKNFKQQFDYKQLLYGYDLCANYSAFKVIIKSLKSSNSSFEYTMQKTLSNNIKLELKNGIIFQDKNGIAFKEINIMTSNLSRYIENCTKEDSILNLRNIFIECTIDNIEDRVKYHMLKKHSGWLHKKYFKQYSSQELSNDISAMDIILDDSKKIEFSDYIELKKKQIEEQSRMKKLNDFQNNFIQAYQSKNDNLKNIVDEMVEQTDKNLKAQDQRQEIENTMSMTVDRNNDLDGLDPPKPNKYRGIS